jgi:hypothetical protein
MACLLLKIRLVARPDDFETSLNNLKACGARLVIRMTLTKS